MWDGLQDTIQPMPNDSMWFHSGEKNTKAAMLAEYCESFSLWTLSWNILREH